MDHDSAYWTDRYLKQNTGWDAGGITPPLRQYFDQLTARDATILIPGCGNAYEAEYLHYIGFGNVYVVDISLAPLQGFMMRVPDFPKDHILNEDFFQLDYRSKFDLIVEQTFFSSIHPDQRPAYAAKMLELLAVNGKLVGVLFDDPLFADHPPYGGSPTLYRPILEKNLQIKVFERCHNSLAPRQGREVFFICQKR